MIKLCTLCTSSNEIGMYRWVPIRGLFLDLCHLPIYIKILIAKKNIFQSKNWNCKVTWSVKIVGWIETVFFIISFILKCAVTPRWAEILMLPVSYCKHVRGRAPELITLGQPAKCSQAHWHLKNGHAVKKRRMHLLE